MDRELEGGSLCCNTLANSDAIIEQQCRLESTVLLTIVPGQKPKNERGISYDGYIETMPIRPDLHDR
jgi:hypothetical protein